MSRNRWGNGWPLLRARIPNIRSARKSSIRLRLFWKSSRCPKAWKLVRVCLNAHQNISGWHMWLLYAQCTETIHPRGNLRPLSLRYAERITRHTLLQHCSFSCFSQSLNSPDSILLLLMALCQGRSGRQLLRPSRAHQSSGNSRASKDSRFSEITELSPSASCPRNHFLNCTIVYLQCCVNFCHTAKWFSLYIQTWYIYILSHIHFHYGLSQHIEYSSLCYTVEPCVYPWLLILAISKYTLQWHEVYSHCYTTITTFHLHINLIN